MNVSFSTLKTQLAADKKKATILGVLLVVLLVAVARLFAPAGSGVPAAGPAIVAAIPVAAGDPNLSRPIATPITAAPTQVGPTAAGPAQTPVMPQAVVPDKRVRVSGRSRSLSRDLFSTPDWAQFPRAIDATQAAPSEAQAPAKQPGGILSAVQTQFREYRKARAAESKKIREAISKLTLQSTLTGITRSAYISGRLVHEGDPIEGLTVVEIHDREVVLGLDGITGRLRMD